MSQQSSSSSEVTVLPARETKEREEKKALPIVTTLAEIEVPKFFYCPISGQIMFEAVINTVERTYERESILLHMVGPIREAKDPITKQVLTNRTLINNRLVRDIIEEFLTQHPQFRAEQYLPVSSMQSAIARRDDAEVRRLLALDTTYRFVAAQTDGTPQRPLKELAASSSSPAIKTAFQQAENAWKASLARTSQPISSVSTVADRKRAASSLVTMPDINHYSLLTRLIAALQVAPEHVFEGVVVEQSLVGLAGIRTEQTGAEFRRATDGSTVFKLRFSNTAEATKFRQFYDQHYPGVKRQLLLPVGDN